MRCEAVFGREAPLLVEVGFGDGRFIVDFAREEPRWNVLGIESSAGSLERAMRRLKREGVRGARIVHGDAPFVLKQLTAPSSIARLVFNFPDPWPKSKHSQHRLLSRTSFERFATRLVERGEIRLTTDDENYAKAADVEALATGLFEIEHREPPSVHLGTKYAQKWLRVGRKFHHTVFTKIAEAPTPWPVLEKPDMPHALMSGTLPALANFERRVLKRGEVSVAYVDAFRTFDGNAWLLLAHIDEPDLVQQILIEARPSERGLHVGLGSFGQPIATVGVHTAIDGAIEWLESFGLRVEKRWYRAKDSKSRDSD
jgi:tRNA (guanine-N7-)-methyltransferase